MSRKGYDSEYTAKLELIKQFGKKNVIKVAIGGAVDFIAIKKGRIDLQVEVKQTIAKKYYPLPQEKEQIERIIAFGEEHNVQSELWVFYRKGAGRKTEKVVKVLYEHKILNNNIDKT